MPTIIIGHGKAKFNLGDKCRFNGRVPGYIARDLRRRARTIVQTFYDPDNQCSFYQLGGRGKSTLDYWFRSYMLIAVNGSGHTIGRPHNKRQYNHRKVNSKLLLASPNQNLGGDSINFVFYYPTQKRQA